MEQIKVTRLDGESLFTNTYREDARVVLSLTSFKLPIHFSFSLFRRVTFLKFAISRGGLGKFLEKTKWAIYISEA